MKSPAPPECGVLAEVQGRAWRDCIPLHVSLELTLRCNLRCSHCYNFDRDAPPPSPPDLGFEEILRLLDDLRSAGTLFLSLTGGEPMAHPRFWDILDEAAARRFAVTLLTNGTFLTEEACDRLARYGNLWQASLSLYGACPATHEGITRTEGSFRRTMDGARRLKARGIPSMVKFVVQKANAHEAAAMIRMAEDEDFPYLVDTSITVRYDGTPAAPEGRVDSAALEALYRGPLRPLLTKGNPDPSDDDFKCNCARGNAAVSASGDVWPCVAAPIRAGNVRERPFTEIWAESPVFRRIRGLRLADFEACAPCPLKAWCNRNPGMPYLLNGDYTGADPWTCREAEIIRGILE